VIGNAVDFGFQVTETGGGYTWSVNSRENRLTPWSNDAVSDTPGEVIYLRDEDSGTVWSVTPERDLFEGWHDGYLRLTDPVKHWRRITLDKRERSIVVEDTLEMQGAHQVELHFHWGENVRVELDGLHCAATRGSRTVSLQLPRRPEARSYLRRGSVAPLGGWISRCYDHKEPTSTVVWRGWLAGTTVLRSEIRC